MKILRLILLGLMSVLTQARCETSVNLFEATNSLDNGYRNVSSSGGAMMMSVQQVPIVGDRPAKLELNTPLIITKYLVPNELAAAKAVCWEYSNGKWIAPPGLPTDPKALGFASFDAKKLTDGATYSGSFAVNNAFLSPTYLMRMAPFFYLGDLKVPSFDVYPSGADVTVDAPINVEVYSISGPVNPYWPMAQMLSRILDHELWHVAIDRCAADKLRMARAMPPHDLPEATSLIDLKVTVELSIDNAFRKVIRNLNSVQDLFHKAETTYIQRHQLSNIPVTSVPYLECRPYPDFSSAAVNAEIMSLMRELAVTAGDREFLDMCDLTTLMDTTGATIINK